MVKWFESLYNLFVYGSMMISFVLMATEHGFDCSVTWRSWYCYKHIKKKQLYLNLIDEWMNSISMEYMFNIIFACTDSNCWRKIYLLTSNVGMYGLLFNCVQSLNIAIVYLKLLWLAYYGIVFMLIIWTGANKHNMHP